jgi:filamentous hemagglutinin family protein
MIAVSGKVLHRLFCLAAVCACAGTAFAGPAGPVVSAGRASYDPATLTVTSTTARTQISWQSFNVAANEVVKFVQPNAQSSVLNQVFNPQSLNILGGLNSNGSVLFMNNGIVSGADLNLDLAGMISTSLRMPPMTLALNAVSSPAQSRPLTTLAEGSIFVISQDEQALTTASGDVLLNPGKTVELAHAAMPNLRVELTAPDTEAINLSRLVGGKRETGIFAGLFRVPAAARQATQRDADAVLTASANQHAPATPDIERFYRYALLYAQMRRESPQHAGGVMQVAAAPAGRTMLPAARSRPSLLPRDIEIAAPTMMARTREAAPRLASLPVSAAAERAMVTLEPQPIPVALESESERSRATLLAFAPVLPAAEVVATLEPQPIPAALVSEPERSGTMLLALAPASPTAEVVATLEPQPILLRQAQEPEDLRTLASQLAAAQPPAQTKPVQVAHADVDLAHGRHEAQAAPTVIVVALAQHGAAPGPREDSKVKEVRIERRAPRYCTDYRGAMFFM